MRNYLKIQRDLSPAFSKPTKRRKENYSYALNFKKGTVEYLILDDEVIIRGWTDCKLNFTVLFGAETPLSNVSFDQILSMGAVRIAKIDKSKELMALQTISVEFYLINIYIKLYLFWGVYFIVEVLNCCGFLH